MVEVITRPFTDAERKSVHAELQSAARNSRDSFQKILHSGLMAAFSWFVPVGTFALFGVVFFALPQREAVGIVLFGIICGLAIGIRHELYQARWESAHLQRKAKRLQRGEMEEVTINASSVVLVDVSEFDRKAFCIAGTNNGYFFDVANNKVFFLWANTLENADEVAGIEEPFPPHAFRLTRYPDAPDTLIELQRLGSPFPVQRTIYIELPEREYFDLVDGTVIANVSLATLESDLPGIFPPPTDVD